MKELKELVSGEALGHIASCEMYEMKRDENLHGWNSTGMAVVG